MPPARTTPRRRPAAAVKAAAAVASLAVLLAGCAISAADTGRAGPLRVVAAENTWGSIAEQVGGDKVAITTLISNPAIDPHDYEPTAADARAVATAQLVIVNGLGYDSWASKLLAANPSSGREVIDVGKLVGAAPNANPHRWYNPSDVRRVVAGIADALAKAEPASSGYFATQRHAFETAGLARYDTLIADIKARYSGTPIGISESIFAMMAPALGLRVLTPAGFERAITDGSDPTARDKSAIDTQIKNREIKVYVYNAQNATPDVRAQVSQAQAAGIPVVTITETPVPETARFQDWQSDQLAALSAALEKAGRS